MHSQLSMQDAAHLRELSGPAPARPISSTPLMMSSELAPAIPAGVTLGQTSTHLPHRVQASSISSTRASSAVSNEVSLIGRGSPPLKRGDVSSNRHPAPCFCLSMIFSENRYPTPRVVARGHAFPDHALAGEKIKPRTGPVLA